MNLRDYDLKFVASEVHEIEGRCEQNVRRIPVFYQYPAGGEVGFKQCHYQGIVMGVLYPSKTLSEGDCMGGSLRGLQRSFQCAHLTIRYLSGMGFSQGVGKVPSSISPGNGLNLSLSSGS